jgi:hypothetical protein
VTIFERAHLLSTAVAYMAIGAIGKYGGQARLRPVFAALALAIAGATACNPTGVVSHETIGSLRYTSEPSLVSETPLLLIDHIVIKNVGRHTQFLSSGVCPTGMRAYRTADRRGAPVYDEIPGADCISLAVAVPLAPDSSMTFGAAVSAAQLQTAGVPAGHYWFAGVIDMNGGVIELAAGDATFSP